MKKLLLLLLFFVSFDLSAVRTRSGLQTFSDYYADENIKEDSFFNINLLKDEDLLFLYKQGKLQEYMKVFFPAYQCVIIARILGYHLESAYSCFCSCFDCKKLMNYLETGFSEEQKNKALRLAVEQELTKACVVLAELGASADQSYGDSSLLHKAISLNNSEMVSILITCGAKLNFNSESSGTPLNYALHRYSLDELDIDVLLEILNAINDLLVYEKKQILNTPTETGIYPIHRAIAFKSCDIVTFLLDIGVDLNVCIGCCLSILQFAQEFGNEEIVCVVQNALDDQRKNNGSYFDSVYDRDYNSGYESSDSGDLLN